MVDPRLQKLLNVSVALSEEAKQSGTERKGSASSENINPDILNAILGKSDVELMVETMQCIENPHDTLENKEIAFDNLELLVEQLDNANNLENADLWEPLIHQFENPEPSLRKMAAWVCGTAVQNNMKSQLNFLRHNGLEPLLKLVQSDPDQHVRAKAVYAVSSETRHNPLGLQKFKELGGWDIFASLLVKESGMDILKRVVFFFGNLLLDDGELFDVTPELEKWNILALLTRLLIDNEIQSVEDIVEKALSTIRLLLIRTSCKVPPILKDDLVLSIQNSRERYQEMFTAQDWDEITQIVQNN